jgi:hypothetical protein
LRGWLRRAWERLRRTPCGAWNCSVCRGARSRGEREALRQARSGDWANFVEGDELFREAATQDDVVATSELDEANWIRASFLRDLLTAGDGHVHRKGVRIRGTRVTGKLDLEAVRGLPQLTLRGCWLDETPVFEQAQLDWLELSCCRVPKLRADQLSVTYSLVLTRTRFETHVQLRRASIEGPVDLSECRVPGKLCLAEMRVAGSLKLTGLRLGSEGDKHAGTESERSALYADSIRVENRVQLDKLDAWGRVRLVGAVVGGSFYMDNAAVRVAGGIALRADRIDVAGNASLNRSTFKGVVWLRDAKIGGKLTCMGTKLSNPPLVGGGDAALSEGLDLLHEAKVFLADQAEIGGDVRLSHHFESTGCVSFLGATVSGSMVVDGAKLAAIEPDEEPKEETLSHRHIAFDGEGMQVKSRLTWKPAEAIGYVDLRYASVHRLDDKLDGWPMTDKGKSYLTGLVYEELAHEFREPAHLQNRIAWLKRQAHYSSQPYEQLSRFYRNSGHNRHADEVGIAREEARLDQIKGSDFKARWARTKGWLHRWTTGYGFKPLQAGWVLVLLFVLTLVPLTHAKEQRWIEPSKASEDADVSRQQLKTTSLTAPQPAKPFQADATTTTVPSEQADKPQLPRTNDCDDTYPCFSTFLYSLETVVPLINLRQAEYWTINAKHPTARHIRWWLGLSAILGWVLVTFTAGSALVARR